MATGIELTPVTDLTGKPSSNVSHLGHDGRSTMHVRYHSGHRYEVHGVSSGAYRAVLAAPSVGRAVRELLDGRSMRRVE